MLEEAERNRSDHQYSIEHIILISGKCHHIDKLRITQSSFTKTAFFRDQKRFRSAAYPQFLVDGIEITGQSRLQLLMLGKNIHKDTVIHKNIPVYVDSRNARRLHLHDVFKHHI